MMYILDDKGNPVLCEDTVEWGTWFEKHTPRRILGRTHITSDIYVSTVFLATDHGLGILGSKPVLWETMVFGMKGDLADECERYTSREDAIRGHIEMVDKVRKEWDNEKTKRWAKINKINTNPASITVNHCPYCHMIQPNSIGWQVTCSNNTI